MSEPITNLEDAVRERGALPLPVGPGPQGADKLTTTFMATQVLREDPHDGPLHHDYRIPRDLPETGGRP
jgi:hypothetical protein